MPISEFTGEEIESTSEEWRHECEIRFILSIATREKRLIYVNGNAELQSRKNSPAALVFTRKGIRQRRGDEAADKIISDCLKLHELRKQRIKSDGSTISD